MKKVSRRAFSGAMLSASALAGAQEPRHGQSGESGQSGPAAVEGISGGRRPFRISRRAVAADPVERAGPPRKYFAEWLPALFERTLEIEELERREAAVAMDFHRAVRGLHGGSGRRQSAAGGALLRFAGAEQGAAGAAASGRAIRRACGRNPASSMAET